MFLNGREKHTDSHGMLAFLVLFVCFVFFSANVLKAVCDILNEIENVLKIMFFVLQVRMTVCRSRPLAESSLMKLKVRQT